MDRFPVELLVYGAIFLVILMFNYLSRRAQSQKPQPESEYEPSPQERPYPEYQPTPEFWGRGMPPAEAMQPSPPVPVEHVQRMRPPATRLAPKRYTRRSLFGSKNDLRRAVVLMTVLGPCPGAESSERGR